MAKADGIELSQRHWDLLKYLRDEFANGGNQPKGTMEPGEKPSPAPKRRRKAGLVQDFQNDPAHQGDHHSDVKHRREKRDGECLLDEQLDQSGQLGRN